MPNWCLNNVDIVGPTEKVDQFMDATMTEENEFNNLLESLCPLGEWDYHETLEKWGTKWDVEAWLTSEMEFEEIGRSFIRIHFDSAWGPPVEAFTTGSKLFPELKFGMTWMEGGMLFFGGIIINNGNTVHYHSGNMPNFYEGDLDDGMKNEMEWWNSWVESRKYLLGS